MELIGTFHEKQFIPDVVKYLDKNHPNLETLMLQLEPNWRKVNRKCKRMLYDALVPYFGRKDASDMSRGVDKPDFFAELEKIYKNKGVRIVYGNDDCDAIDSVRFEIKTSLKPQKDGTATYTSFSVYDPIYTYKIKERNEKLISVIKRENPEAAIIGLCRTNYIKRRMPEVRYVALLPGDFELHKCAAVRKDLVRRETPRNANLVVNLKTKLYPEIPDEIAARRIKQYQQ